MSFAKNSAGVLEVTDTNNYYPFGLNHISGMFGNSNFGSYYSYKYNGKELQETGMYDYGARFYMPDLGRWGVVDPLAEKYRRWSPYNYTVNNPIRFTDPDGRSVDDWRNKQGQLIYDPKANNGKGAYTEHATANDRNLGNGLRNSGETGNKQFQTLINSEHPITVEYDMESTSNSKDKGGYQLGVTGNAIEGQKINTKTNEVVDVIISESNIKINVGIISEFVSDVRSGKQDATEKGEKIVKNNTKLTAFDVAIATLGHEIDHSQSKNQTDKANGKNPETIPTQIAEQILQDIANKKNNEKN